MLGNSFYQLHRRKSPSSDVVVCWTGDGWSADTDDGVLFRHAGRDGDQVFLQRTDVALLLCLLMKGADGSVVAATPRTSMLRVKTTYDGIGEATVVFKTDNNEIQLEAYERDMFVTALESQVWRFFR